MNTTVTGLSGNTTSRLQLGEEVAAAQIATRPPGERLQYERHETEGLLGTAPAQQSARIDEDLALSQWLVQLRLLSDGKSVGLLANLPQDVTHVDVTVTSGSGASRTFRLPKDADFQAKLGLGKLANGTKVTITALNLDDPNGAERGPPLELVWSKNTRPSPNVSSYVQDLERLADGAGKLGPEGVAQQLTELTRKFQAWPDSDQLYLWSDAGVPSRQRTVAAFEKIVALFPDAKVEGRTLTEMLEVGRQGEAAWLKQRDDLEKALG